MIKKTFLFLFGVALICAPASAQKPSDKPLTEDELLKQIEALTPPSKAKGTPVPKSLFDAPTPADETKPGAEKAKGPKKENSDRSGEKKGKGPTEITALEATFDQKANLAIFIGSVVVKDPEFNVTCDKLTANLKHEDKTAASSAGPAAKSTPKPATPNPGEAGAPKKKGGGLEKAFAESTSDKRVVITQDKEDGEGKTTHSVGISDKATYDAVTGEVVLTGSPEVTQGINRCIATDPSTVMTLTRDGHMKAVGPHKTIIVDKGDLESSK